MQNISNHIVSEGNQTDAIFGGEICSSKMPIQNNTSVYAISQKAFKLERTGLFSNLIDLWHWSLDSENRIYVLPRLFKKAQIWASCGLCH